MISEVSGRAGRTFGTLRRWAPAVTVATLVGVVVVPRPALAIMDILQADDNVHSYCLTSNFTTAPNVAHNAMSVLDTTTEFGITNSGTCSGNRTASLIDVWWSEVDLPAGVLGQEQCRVQKGGSTDPFLLPYCETADIRFDFPAVDAPTTNNDALDREKNAVHELGHSVGLGHHETRICAMRSGRVVETTTANRLAERRFEAADITMINDNY